MTRVFNIFLILEPVTPVSRAMEMHAGSDRVLLEDTHGHIYIHIHMYIYIYIYTYIYIHILSIYTCIHMNEDTSPSSLLSYFVAPNSEQCYLRSSFPCDPLILGIDKDSALVCGMYIYIIYM